MDAEEILTTFYDIIPFERREIKGGPAGWATPYKPERWRGVKPEFPLIDADTGEEIAPAGQKISARAAKKFADGGVKTLLLAPDALVGRFLARGRGQLSRPVKSTPKPVKSWTRLRSRNWKPWA